MQSSCSRDLPIAVALVVLASFLASGCSRRAARDKPAGLDPSPGALPGAAPAPSPSPSPAPAPAPAPAPVPAGGGQAEAVPGPADPAQSIAGSITLPAARRKDVARGDSIFIIARRSGGPPGPASMLAVQRHTAGDFPLLFTISSRDAMVPGTPFAGEVSLSVRVDKDGDPISRRKGDVFGQANAVKVGSRNVTISLDSVQKEDVTLGPGTAGAGPGHPAGLPPGHP